MSIDWNDFLADGLFDNPTWPSTTEKNSDNPAGGQSSLPSQQMPIFDYSTFEFRPYDNQYTALPYNQITNNVPLPEQIPRSSRAETQRMEEPVPSIESKDNSLETSKRTKNGMDNISACWTSPLCPNHSADDGSPPDPSICGAACAPFLFTGPGDSLSTALDEAFLSNEIRIESDEQPTTANAPLDRPLKRSESESEERPTGRPNQQQSKTRPFRKDESISQGDDTSPDASYDAPENASSRKTSRRQPHNQVERKYRESLNTQLESLRKVVPSLRPEQPATGTNGSQTADIEDLPIPTKPSKAVVLASATAYIRQMEKEKKQMADENKLLRTRVSALQALVKCEDCSLMQYVMNLNLSGKQ